MVEEGRFAIDDFLVYRLNDNGRIERKPVDHCEYTENDGKRMRLCWVDGTWTFFPVSTRPLDEGVEQIALIEVSSSGDVAYVEKTGHFHPNKPPGTSFLALPAYFVIYKIERALGIDTDQWWTLNLNLWLTTIFSIGLLSAVSCVLFFRLVREFTAGSNIAALSATIALAFGTTFFPFATIFFDHAATAALLIASFYCICWDRCSVEKPCALNGVPADLRHLLAGLSAGFAVVTNYVAVGAVVALGVYALLANGGLRWRRAIIFALGGIPFALLLGWYHTVNFGSPLAIANDFQNPIFKDQSGAVLGMFNLPNPYVGALISVSPYRGIFWLSPILILGLVGLVVWLCERTWVPEARLALAIFGFFFFVNMAFNGYHGGFSAGPRYLVPGLPFLALGLAVPLTSVRWRSPRLGGAFLAVIIAVKVAECVIGVNGPTPLWPQITVIAAFFAAVAAAIVFASWRILACLLIVISIFQNTLLTATDGQCSLAVGGHARIDDAHRKDDFFCDIVSEYAAPFFLTNRCGPLLRQMTDIEMEKFEARLDTEQGDLTPASREQALLENQASLEAAIQRGDRDPFPLAAIEGPVSINPVAAYDGLLGYGLYPLGSEPSRWSSCNAGEFFLPRSRWSVLPVILGVALLLFAAYRSVRSLPEPPLRY